MSSSLMQGFNEGVMIIGPHAGLKVSEVKPVIKAEMVAAGQALIYSEPEKQVGHRAEAIAPSFSACSNPPFLVTDHVPLWR